MVELEWAHQNSDSVKFEIQVSVDNGPFSEFATTDAGVSEFSGTLPLDLDSEYKFRIAGVKGDQKSNFTEAESFVFRVNPPKILLLEVLRAARHNWTGLPEMILTRTISWRSGRPEWIHSRRLVKE
jgi:hypothetical protein